MRHFIGTLCLLLSASFFIAGCDTKRPEGMPETYPVTVTVKLDGVALEGAEVGAYPLDKDNTKWFGFGLATDAKGIVKMKSSEINGLIAGEFTVTVKKNLITSTESGDVYECFVEKAYWGPVTSPLRIQVEPKGKNEFEFDVPKFDPTTFDEVGSALRLKK
jgi:hypothetical protein